MADVILHGYIQLAKRLAEDAPYSIAPINKGWNVCRRRLGYSPLPIAFFTHKADAEDFVFVQIAILGN